MPRISIVMSFLNRQTLLDKTMESIRASSMKDYEVVITDDASNPPLVCEGAKIIRVEPKDKWYHNPCIPYNMAIKESTGDIVIIQNPECYHVGDVLEYVANNAREGLYISFSCYAINRRETEALAQGMLPAYEWRKFYHPVDHGWYNHSTIKPMAYHFCSAIMRKDITELGGFDERYASGIGFDDDDMVKRIKKRGMEIAIIDYPFVIHQHHEPMSYMIPAMKRFHQRNRGLYQSLWGRS